MIDTVVSAPGSLGDVNPMLAIARELKACGRRVVFVAAERYLPVAGRAGLETRVLVSEEVFSQLISDPQLWHPRHGVKKIFQSVVGDSLADHFAWLNSLFEKGQPLLVGHFLDFALRMVRETHPNAFLASVVLAPALLRSVTTPPRVSGFGWERSIPKWLIPFGYRLADWWIDKLAAHPINRFRNSIGLPPVHRLLKDWWLSPDLALGMFPDWYSVPMADVPEQMELCGFPLADRQDLNSPSERNAVDQLLSNFNGEPPVVFAPGTAHVHGRKFFEIACTVCRQLNLPGVLISSDASQIPVHTESRIVTAKYVPFSYLLRESRAIVHHGGVGTTSQALAAGIPQIVLPMAFDQFDNAERVEILGCGGWFPMRKLSPARLKQALSGVLSGQSDPERVRAISQRLSGGGSGAQNACKLILSRLAARSIV